MKSDLVDIEGDVAQIREKAIAITTGEEEDLNDGRKRLKWFWLPLSRIEIYPESPHVGQRVTATMPERFAIEKGLV